MSAVIVYQKAEDYLLKCDLAGNRVFHVELRQGSQVKLEERGLSASTGGRGLLAHSNSKVELEKCEIKDEPRTLVEEGMKSGATVSK
jgi:hypothetical protein